MPQACRRQYGKADKGRTDPNLGLIVQGKIERDSRPHTDGNPQCPSRPLAGETVAKIVQWNGKNGPYSGYRNTAPARMGRWCGQNPRHPLSAHRSDFVSPKHCWFHPMGNCRCVYQFREKYIENAISVKNQPRRRSIMDSCVLSNNVLSEPPQPYPFFNKSFSS